MNTIFLCCKLEADLAEGTLSSIINQHQQLSILIRHKCVYFSSSDFTVLAILTQELRNGVYPEFSKDVYQMLAETEDQMSKVTSNSVKISCKEDIFLYFEGKVLKTEAVQEFENHSITKTKETVDFSGKNEAEEISNNIPINVSDAASQLTHTQTKEQWEENQEAEQVQKIHLQFCEGMQQERCFANSSLLAKQTKIQAIQSNVQQSLKCNPTKNQTQVVCDQAKTELVEQQKDLQVLQKSQAIQIEENKNELVLQNKVDNHLKLYQFAEKIQNFSITKEEKTNCESQLKIQSQQQPFMAKGSNLQILQTIEKIKAYNNRQKQSEAYAVLESNQNLIKKKNMFIVSILIIWIFVLLKLYL